MQQFGQAHNSNDYAYGSCNSSCGVVGDRSPRGDGQRMQGSCCSAIGDRSPSVSKATEEAPASAANKMSKKETKKSSSSTKKSKSKNPSAEQTPFVRGSLAVPGAPGSLGSSPPKKMNKPGVSSCSSSIGVSPAGSPVGSDNDID